MDLNIVIRQIRTYSPSLGGRVTGAGDFDTGIESVIALTDTETGALAYPAAAVIPLADDVTANLVANGLVQTVTEMIAVIVIFDATRDRRGQAGVSGVEAMRADLFRALLGWNIDPNRGARGLYYAGGEVLQFDRARLFYEFRFAFEATITEADGFLRYGDPLVEVRETIPVENGPASSPAPEIDIDLKGS